MIRKGEMPRMGKEAQLSTYANDARTLSLIVTTQVQVPLNNLRVDCLARRAVHG